LSAIHDLIGQIGDPRLRERLAAEWKAASTGKKFGLVFEDHLPELLPLPKARPRRGDLVCRRQGAMKEVWQVKSVKQWEHHLYVVVDHRNPQLDDLFAKLGT